jgi:hypothetical protein
MGRLPWVHALVANAKGHVRNIYYGVSQMHLPRRMAGFCYRFNQRFREHRMFKRVMHAFFNTSTITLAEPRA